MRVEESSSTYGRNLEVAVRNTLKAEKEGHETTDICATRQSFWTWCVRCVYVCLFGQSGNGNLKEERCTTDDPGGRLTI